MVAVITGGAKGIGKAIVLKMAESGFDIAINFRSTISDELIKEAESFGVKVIAIKGDVSNENDVTDLFKQIFDTFGSVDVLVNNAGITRDGLMLRMSEQDFDDVINTNLKGAFLCCKSAAKYMIKQKKGRIINITSVVGLFGNAGQANYASSKAGIIGLTKSVAKELGGKGITSNAVAPGFIKTDMTENLKDDIKEAMLSRVSLKSFGEASDVANLVCFLASDNARYITGQVISIDGGLAI